MDSHCPPSAPPEPVPRITGEEKLRSEHEQRRRLEADLAAGRLEFGAGPYEATIQFSNVCNMSCIMCWAGGNPRPRRMSSDILRKVSQEVAPFLSLVTPHFGSEPLLLTWDDTRRLARERGLQLSLPRVAGSCLRYASQGHKANRDLGGGRTAGADDGSSVA